MALEVIGKVKSASGKSWEVKWDKSSRQARVVFRGGFFGGMSYHDVGRASSAGEAMRKAEAFLYDK